MKLSLKKIRCSEKGAAAAEAAITIMTFLIVILGIIQITLAINAKLLLNYAAYCAARAGIVHNGDQATMERAVAVAMAPLFARANGKAGLAAGYAEALLYLNSGMKFLPGFMQVERLAPNDNRFKSSYDKRFFPEYAKYGDAPKGNDLAKLNDNLLTVKVTYNFPLSIPVIKQILSPLPFLHHLKISSTHRMRMQSDKRFQ